MIALGPELALLITVIDFSALQRQVWRVTSLEVIGKICHWTQVADPKLLSVPLSSGLVTLAFAKAHVRDPQNIG